MMENIEKRVIGIFLLVLAVLAFVSIMAIRNIQRSVATSDWVNHTHAVIHEANAILSSLHAGDAALRNYLLTGDKRDQGAYRTAYSGMVEHMDVAKAMTRAEEEQNKKFLQLEGLLNKRIGFTRMVVQTREKEGLDNASKLLAANPDGESIGEIERLVQKLVDEENELLRNRDKQNFLQAQTTRWTVLTGVGVNFVLLAFVGWLIKDDIAHRRRAATALQEANAQLEAKVAERTADLVKTNQSLKQENLERRWSNQALDHQLRYSQLIINSIGDLVFVISKALNISRINPAVLHQTNFEPQDVIAQPLDHVLQLADEDTANAQNPLLQAMKEGREIQERAAQIRTRSGQLIPVRFSLVPLRDQDKVVGGVLTARLVPAEATKAAS